MTRMQRLIRQVVAIAGGSQRPAADLLGITQPSICRYLSGKSKPMPSVILLARAIVTKAGRKPAA